VVIDYLQLMRGRNVENRQQEISEISRSLKALAKELAIPVVALSQLSRAVEARQSKDYRPQLSDSGRAARSSRTPTSSSSSTGRNATACPSRPRTATPRRSSASSGTGPSTRSRSCSSRSSPASRIPPPGIAASLSRSSHSRRTSATADHLGPCLAARPAASPRWGIDSDTLLCCVPCAMTFTVTADGRSSPADAGPLSPVG